MADLIELWNNYVDNTKSENFGKFQVELEKATKEQLKDFKKKYFNNLKTPDEEQYKYKKGKNVGKTKSFRFLEEEQMRKLLMEAVKKSPSYAGTSGDKPETPTGGKGEDKPETPAGDKGEDPETVNKFIAEQVDLITNGKLLDGFTDLNNFLKETKNDAFVLSKLIDAFKGISSKKDVKKSHKYASDYYIDVLQSKKEGKITSTNFDALKYKQLKEGGEAEKVLTEQLKEGPELVKNYVDTLMNDIQKRYDTSKLSQAQREELGEKLVENYYKPTELREDADNIFNQVVKGLKNQYKHTKTSQEDKPTQDEPPPTQKPTQDEPPEPVEPLPPVIQPSKIKVEDIQTDLDRYRQSTKKLKNLLEGKNAEGTQEKLKDFEYDTVRYRLLNGKPMTDDERQHMNEIKDVKKEIEKYEEGAKKIAKEMLEKDRRTVQATQRIGLLGPHLMNDTTKAVKEQLDKTPEQQIKDIENWYIFDIPIDSTGQGTKIDNPLIAQNEMREKMLLEGSTLFTSLSNYTLEEGPFERKDFFHLHPELTKAGIGRGIFEVETEETKEDFLQKFNEGNNGLFSQDQTREELNDFQNIYQKPGRMIGGADYKLDFTNNRGIKHTDKVWLSNLNLFFDNAPML